MRQFNLPMVVYMIIRWAVTDFGHEQVINGDFVLYSDYESLRAALREALNRWQQIESETLYKGMAADRDRIAALRKEFLDV